MGASGKTLAIKVYAERELIPFRFDLGVAVWANIGSGEDDPIGYGADHRNKEKGWGDDHVPRCFNGFAKPVDSASAKGDCAQKQKEEQCDLFHFFCPFLNSAGLKNS